MNEYLQIQIFVRYMVITDHKENEEETAGEEIARSIQVDDPRGRKHHCNFMISKIEQTVSQSERKFSKTTD